MNRPLLVAKPLTPAVLRSNGLHGCDSISLLLQVGLTPKSVSAPMRLAPPLTREFEHKAIQAAAKNNGDNVEGPPRKGQAPACMGCP